MLANLLDALRRLLGPTRNRIIAGTAGALLLIVGAVALTSGGSDEPPPTTTTTSTTAPSSTTTAAPKPVAPLTGVVGEFGGRTQRPALVVKIDNVEPKARRQAGLNQADVVYEERVEGSVTRLLAIFHSTDAAPVGPVRSARSSDISIFSPLNRPYFAWSGANDTFTALIRQAAVQDLGYSVVPGQYYRASDRPAPSNLMLRSTADLLAIDTQGSKIPPALFQYRRKPGSLPAHAEKVAGVRVTYGTSAGSAPVEYRWTGKGWARWQAGTPHVDAVGTQVAPENVIIQFTPYESSGVVDQFGNPIPEAHTIGSGEAWVLTDGVLVVARWRKTSRAAVTTYSDVDGNPIGLSPGRTWIALPQPGGAVRL